MTSYPSGMTLRPIEAWPRAETRNRQRSNFSAPWAATLELLDRELHYLGKGNRRAESVLQIAMRERDFRIDGMPRANAIPLHPGVILNLVDSVKGPLSFPCDKFDRWTDNLRAIALSLEALRKVDRYGTTPGNEQYRGWQALPQKGSHPAWTAEQAEEFLRGLVKADGQGLNIDTLPQVYRRVRRDTHPDRNDGDRTVWDKVEHAAGILTAAGAL